jgi:HD superfamily phosphodiesterase
MLDQFTAKLDEVFAKKDQELVEKDQRIAELEARVAEFEGAEASLMERYGLNDEVVEEEVVPTPEQFEEDVLEAVEGEPV